MEAKGSRESPAGLNTITIAGDWDWQRVLAGELRAALEAAIAGQIVTRRWFGAKGRTIAEVQILDAIPVTPDVHLVLIEIGFTQGPAEVYQIPLGFAAGVRARDALAQKNSALWALIAFGERNEKGVLYDPLGESESCAPLLGLFDSEAVLPGTSGQLVARQTGPFMALRGDHRQRLPAKLLNAEQSNSSIVFGDRVILKLFRRIEMGLNPDLEITARLTVAGFASVPPLAGAVEYRRAGQEPLALAMLQGFVANQGNAWDFTLARLERFLADNAEKLVAPSLSGDGLATAAIRVIPSAVTCAFEPFPTDAARLGTRTAELHLQLAADTDDPDFAPEPASDDDQRLFRQRASDLTLETFALLRDRRTKLPAEVRGRAEDILRLESAAYEHFNRFGDQPIVVSKIRCHGDYHLGQVLVTDDDFMIIDFEGEPARPLPERRQKNFALRDVAGMIRSFHYASCAAAAAVKQRMPAGDPARVDDLAKAWYFWTSAAFLAAYRHTAAGAVFVPAGEEDFGRLLDACLLEKAVYELRYELNTRPDWVYLPLEALGTLLSTT
jgi:maltose alpha-D-glucosyltransferase/alpha-amylase